MPASRSLLLRGLFSFIFLLSVSYVSGQNYQQIGRNIDSLVKLGLPKSALVEVDKLAQLARKNKDAAEQVGAAVYRMTLQSYIEDDALLGIIDSLRSDINHAQYPVKPVLQSLLGSMYNHYYQQNRWRFSQRTKLTEPSADFTKWDLQTLITETGNLYKQSLAEASREQATSVSVLDGVLIGDETTRYLRPTLYDLLLHRALDFFLADEPALTKPKLAFSVNDSRYFGDSQTFVKLKLTQADTSSTYYTGLQLLQQATLFHLQQGHTEAVADLDIRRLQFLHQKSSLPDADTLYVHALKQITSAFADKPISADAFVAIAQCYQQKDSLRQAIYYALQARATFPGSFGGHNADNLIKQINRKELSSSIENINIPGKPLLAQLAYRNVKKVTCSVYALTWQQRQQYDSCWGGGSMRYYNRRDRTKPDITTWVKNFIKAQQPVQVANLQLPDPGDYLQHRTEFKINGLKNGSYILLAQPADGADSAIISYTDFQVSRIAYVTRGRYNKDDIEVYVTDRETGAPLNGVRVKIAAGANSSNQPKVYDEGLTNKFGMFISKTTPAGNVGFTLAYKGDTLEQNNQYVNSGYRYRNDDDDDKTILFTDRQIYRPGQTLYFKGIQLKIKNGKNNIVADTNVTVELYDPNDKVAATAKLRSNSFGTFGGSFALPQNGLNGEFRLKTEDGSINIRVEEYKRPSFSAEFLPVTASYKLNDTVTVKGRAMAYSGYGLSQAKVAYVITRTISGFKYHNYLDRTEIKTDTIKTDDQGAFSFKFKAEDDGIADNKAVYNYSISMDVTDASGETHSANTRVAVGNNNIAIRAYLPNQVWAKDTGRIAVGINNLNGQAQKGSIHIKVYALQSPAHLFKNRLWQKPDLFLMSKDDYHANFQGYAYASEDEVVSWTRLKQFIDTTFTVDNVKKTSFTLNNLRRQASGMYQVIISAHNEKGDTTSIIRYIHLVTDHEKPSAMDNWVVPVKALVKAGSEAVFSVGIDEPVKVLMEKYSQGKIVLSQWFNIGSEQKLIKVPVNIGDNDVSVQFIMVYQNRVYTSNQPVVIDRTDNILNIRMVTFRDKLQPGDKEQWKLQISGVNNEKQAAELVANMYDASLDDIAPPAYWQNAVSLYLPYRGNYSSWNFWGFVSAKVTQAFANRNYNYPVQKRNYEQIDMLGYNYYGGYNGLYHNYLNGLEARKRIIDHDSELDRQYKNNAALVKNGLDIIGKVVDSRGNILPGVSVNIKGTKIGTSTNSKGDFKIRVLPGGVLNFAFIGYFAQQVIISKADTLIIVLKENESQLREVAVVGYGTALKKDLTGSVAAVSMRNISSVGDFNETLQGSLAGVSVGYGGDQSVFIRGAGSLAADKNVLYIIDGVEGGSIDKLSPADIDRIEVLKDAAAQSIYGARGANGVVIITTKNGKARLMGPQPIVPRTNFNETAFFYPQLHTDDKGEILIDFTMPEALTRWKFRGFAHTADLKTGYIEAMVVTQKQLSINANMPRFLREGDTLTVSARLANLSAGPLKGKVNLRLFNGINMQPVSLLVNPAEAEQSFDVAASTNKAVSFRLVIPKGLDALTYRITADAGNFTDGEENTLPVLPNRMLVTESMPMMVRAGQTKAFTFNKLLNNKSTTLVNKSLTLEYTQNPVWYAVQALPYMMEFPYECSEQLFSRYYANSVATSLVNKLPVIKRVFDNWKTANGTQLLSALEKNLELKNTLIEETPWLNGAISETEQKKRIALLFDLNKMSYELKANLDKLKQRQLADGGFPWFGGDRSDAYITRHILAGMGQLYHLGIVDLENKDFKAVADKAMDYLDNYLLSEARREKKYDVYDGRILGSAEIHAYYTQSYFTARTMDADMQALLANYLKLAETQWRDKGVYEQAMIALTMLRNKKADVAQNIIRSLNETAQHTDEMGMYWGKNQLGYYWYQSPIETQSLLIELFTEAGNNDKAVDEMRIWLLRNKQTNNWKTTKATAAACYALLLKGNDWLADSSATEIKLNDRDLTTLKPDIKADAGTGYIKTTWVDEQVKPELGKVSIKNNGKTINWGSVSWQYLENMDKITPSATDITLDRKYFIQKQGATGAELQAVNATHAPKVGDILKVVVYLKVGRDYEYVQLKDMRPAGTEPVDVLSGYKYQDGLFYYQVTKDVATNFFISNLNKGNYVFEYRLRVAQPGNFSTGISTVQCMYAPEFNAHSEGMRLATESGQ